MPIKGSPLAVRFDALSESQAQKNHSQTLARLKERGGLSPAEALALAHCRKWSAFDHMPDHSALHALSLVSRRDRSRS